MTITNTGLKKKQNRKAEILERKEKDQNMKKKLQ